MNWLEMALVTAPFWLLALGRLARARAGRRLLTGCTILVAIELALLFWLEHDCGHSGIIGFSGICGVTPPWLAGLLEPPVILGVLALPVLIALSLITALIIEILHRRR
ncbi:hypothetical protein PE067_04835 [Paracoccus sp. DMF-8]|uniref:hypothetical protein n=1 Tax=Paracoccus sp. DMF-8 TaxID=3019445 RepID=UPI0023E7C458|nr:hypothetical protein [Paracoccus sp. DMF-8]MDF3605533.1 hypothetical protein [Paracoccus sp. DMF-8]